MFTSNQRAAVHRAFALAGYDGQLVTASVTSEDERIFLFAPADLAGVADVRALEQDLQRILRRKVWVVERVARWGEPIQFE